MYELAFKILDNIDPHYKKDLIIHEKDLTAMGNINNNKSNGILS